MMGDNMYSIYDVVEEAEKYFEGRSKGKGSGWKNYQRWLYENEHKYYPSGDRSSVDPYFVVNSYNNFLRNNSAARSLFDNGWEDLGPYYIGEVSGHYSVGLGRVESYYADPNDDQRIYLGSRSGGFWMTIDGGTTWSGSTTDFLPVSGVNTMTVSPTNPNSILINIRNAYNGTTHGIYRSTTGGDNWELTDFNPINLGWGGLGSNRVIYKIAFHPSIANLVFIGTNEGLFRSDDNLDTWTQLLTSYDINEIVFHPHDADIMYCAANNDKTIVLVSDDTGQTFSSSSISGNNSTVHIATSGDCPNCVFVGTSNGIWKSTDEGMNFSLFSTPGISNYGAFAVSDMDASIMLFGDIDTHMSTDGGSNFTKTTFWNQGNSNYHDNTAYVHADIRGAQCRDGVFWSRTDGFLNKSLDNGISWERFEGQGIRENYNLGVSQSNHYRTICGSQDNGSSIKTESGWIEFYGADGMEGIIHPLNDDWMIGSYQYGGRRRTKDGGYSNGLVTPEDQSGAWIAPLFYSPNDQMTVYSLGENVHRSEDFGTTWTNVGTPGFTGSIQYASIAENNSDIIVVSRYQNIEKSVDGGATFTDIKNNLPDYSITDIAFDPNDDNNIVVSYGRYQNDDSKVYITTDQGANWQNITYNLNNMPVRSVVIDHTPNSTIYLGTEIGVYKKAMADNSWSLYNTDLPNMTILDLEVMRGSNTLRAATWGRGLWEYALDGRENYPAILSTSITNSPEDNRPNEGVHQLVTSVITYDNNITSAYVEWSANNPGLGNTISMNNTSGDTWVSNTPLPNYPNGTKMYFKVFAVGSDQDTTETYPFMYTVKGVLSADFCQEVATGGDDAEENRDNGDVDISSSDLNFCSDGSISQYVGIRFSDLEIPQGATINSAFLEFWASESDETELDIFISAHDKDDSELWDSSDPYNISVRPHTTDTIIWHQDYTTPWKPNYPVAINSPELKSLVQEVIDRPGWTLNNALSFIFWDNGMESDERVAFSFNGGTPPSLCIDFTIPPFCQLLVSNTAESGAGSFAEALSCAGSGDIITLHSSLDGMTIPLGNNTITIDKDLTILADPSTNITISTTGDNPAMTLLSGYSLTLKNFIIESTSMSMETIQNNGVLEIHDMTIRSNEGNDCIRNISPATLHVFGDCQLQEF